jgi:hypothetical protein
MNAPLALHPAAEQQKSSMLLYVLIRAGLVFALAAFCCKIFAPFLTLMVWALILAVAMYPLSFTRWCWASQEWPTTS